MQHVPDNSLIRDAILDDVEIKYLVNMKSKIYEMAVPTFVLKKDGAEQVWSDEVNFRVHEIDRQIEIRKQQIIEFYNR